MQLYTVHLFAQRILSTYFLAQPNVSVFKAPTSYLSIQQETVFSVQLFLVLLCFIIYTH